VQAVNFAHVVDGCTGPDAIAERWRSHFECLYNSVSDRCSELLFNERISANMMYQCYKTIISVFNIISACREQKLRKATGPYDMAMEAIL